MQHEQYTNDKFTNEQYTKEEYTNEECTMDMYVEALLKKYIVFAKIEWLICKAFSKALTKKSPLLLNLYNLLHTVSGWATAQRVSYGTASGQQHSWWATSQ